MDHLPDMATNADTSIALVIQPVGECIQMRTDESRAIALQSQRGYEIVCKHAALLAGCPAGWQHYGKQNQGTGSENRLQGRRLPPPRTTLLPRIMGCPKEPLGDASHNGSAATCTSSSPRRKPRRSSRPPTPARRRP